VDAQGKSGFYRIGYAVSKNKKDWQRLDNQIDLGVSEKGWDSEMIGAPDVLQMKDHTYLFYCGNHYGREGFGVAEILM
jgi:hypothetical protein